MSISCIECHDDVERDSSVSMRGPYCDTCYGVIEGHSCQTEDCDRTATDWFCSTHGTECADCSNSAVYCESCIECNTCSERAVVCSEHAVTECKKCTQNAIYCGECSYDKAMEGHECEVSCANCGRNTTYLYCNNCNGSSPRCWDCGDEASNRKTFCEGDYEARIEREVTKRLGEATKRFADRIAEIEAKEKETKVEVIRSESANAGETISVDGMEFQF